MGAAAGWSGLARWKDLLGGRPAIFVLGTLVAFTSVLAGHALGWLEPLSLMRYDLQLRLASRAAPERPPPVSLVVIDEEDVRRFGHPLPDRDLDRLLATVLAGDPVAVGVDLYRDLPVPRSPTMEGGWPADHAALAERVTGDPRIVMTMKAADEDGVGTPPPAFLDGPAQVGFSDLPVDPGGTVRRGLLYLWPDELPAISMALQLALRALALEGIEARPAPETTEWLMLGETVVPPFASSDGPYVNADDRGYQILLDYRWGTRPLATLRAGDVLDGRFDPAVLRGRVVLIGTTAVSVKDAFQTPLRPAGRAGMLPGVAIHALAVDQLIRLARGEARPLETPAAAWRWLWVLLFALVGSGLGLWNRHLLLQGSGLLLVAGLAIATGAVAFGRGLWIPLVEPLLASGVASALVAGALAARERAERRELSGLFSRFQGPAVAEEIWRRREEFMQDGRPVSRRVVLTTLMADLEGYTAASEKMEPQSLMAWVNEYMDAMAQIIEAHGGVVDDYAGDGVKANFGFPLPSADDAAIGEDARAAVRCALAMGSRMESLNESWRTRGLPTGRCRVGIFTGPAVVGCIGGAHSLKYTSVGDTVNTAARLEGFAKNDFTAEGTARVWRVLVGEETARRIADGFEIECIGAHALKGKDKPVPIYRVFGERSSPRA